MCCKKPERVARHLDERASPFFPPCLCGAGKVAVSFTQAGMGEWEGTPDAGGVCPIRDDGVGPPAAPTDHAADETVDAASRLPAQTNKKFTIQNSRRKPPK